MSEEVIESKAFQRAALSSESYRILGLLCLLGALMLYVIARGLIAGEFRLLLAQTLVLVLAIAHEAFMLARVKRALLQKSDIQPVMWMLNVLIESQIPTIALFLLIKSDLIDQYQRLIAPAVFLYFLLIILSTLRLSPNLSFISGLASALGYLAVTFYAEGIDSNPDTGSPAFPLAVIQAVLILAGGIIAAVVAGQIRIHVQAALREAELQHKLERVNQDLSIARSIQQGLLPAHSPNLDNFALAGWNQPADQTGGDYFDWQSLPDGRLAISLGDVAGHGIGPALVTASCRAYARASFLAGGPEDGLLNRLNRLLAEDLPSNRFVTFVVALLDPVRSDLEVVSAGHGPILWYRYATKEFEKLEAQGIPLGLMAGFKYGLATKISLAPGDMLILVTDGFYEWENPDGEEFGVTRMEEVICRACEYPPEEVIVRLRSAVLSFCQGTEQKDDLTAVILKRNRNSEAPD